MKTTLGQTCRICGVGVPSGFVNCNSCYYKTDEAKSEEITLLKHASKLKKLAEAWMNKE